jgi:hypothetical protein
MPPLQQHQRADDVAVAMPLGGSADLDVHVKDEFGTSFTAIRDFDHTDAVDSCSSSALAFLRDRADVVNVALHPSGQRLSISAMHQGMAALRVWLRDHPKIDNYLRILVDNIIDPGSAQVVVGGTVQYTVSAFLSRNTTALSGATTTWKSSNSGIATVEPHSGLAKVLAAGSAHIHVDGAVRSYVQLTAVRLASVEFLEAANAFVRNFDAKPYYADIVVKDKSGAALFPLKHAGIDHRLNVQCSVDHSQAVWAEAWSQWDKERGRYVCAIRPLRPDGPEENANFIREMQLHLTVADAGSFDILKASTTITYMHAFRISHLGVSAKPPEPLSLTLGVGEAATVDLFGNADKVKPSSNEPNVVSVRPSGLGLGGAARFEIRYDGGGRTNSQVVQVAFQCLVTGQTELVQVLLTDSGGWSWYQTWYSVREQLEPIWSQRWIAGGLLVLVALFLLVNQSAGTGGSIAATPQHEYPATSPSQPFSRNLRPQVGSPMQKVPGDYSSMYSPAEVRSPLFAHQGLGFDHSGRATIATPRRYDLR